MNVLLHQGTRLLLAALTVWLLQACGGGDGLPPGQLQVSNATPSTLNGTFTLNQPSSTTLVGFTTIKIADPGNVGRFIEIIHGSDNSLVSLFYLSPEMAGISLMTCVPGNVLLAASCPGTGAITLDVPNRQIRFTRATFQIKGLPTGTLDGTLSW